MTYRLEAKLRGYIHGVFPTKLSELENDVPYVSAADGQELTDGQQRAALENVNATEILAENFVRHDVATELSEEAQKVARDNIGTYGKAEIDERIWNIEVDFLDDANKYTDQQVDALAKRTASSIDELRESTAQSLRDIHKDINDIQQDIGDAEYVGFDETPATVKDAINMLASRPSVPAVDDSTIVLVDIEGEQTLKAKAIQDMTSDGERVISPQTIVNLEQATAKISEEVERLQGRGGYLTPYNFEWDGVSDSVQVGDTFNESRNGVKTEITVVADGSGNYPTGTNINLTDAYKKAVDWQIDLMDWATFDIWGAVNRKYGTEGLDEVAEGQRITLSVKSVTAQTEPFCETFGTDADGNSYGVYQQDGKFYFGSFTYDTELQTVTAVESDELWDGVSALKPFRKDYSAPKGIVLNASIERPFGGDSGLSWEENLIVWGKDFYEIFNGTRVINEFNNWEMELTNTQDTEPHVCSWATASIDQAINYADDDTGGIVRTGQTTGEGTSRVYGVQLNDITKQMYVSELGEDLAEITQNVEDKVEKVPSAVENNIAVFDSNGGIKDNNIKASDFATATQGARADEAYQTANEAKSIAEGRSQAKVFDDEDAMEAWLAVSSNTATLNVGDSLLIRAVESPDYWWDGTSAQVFETEKVDLTDYYTKAEVDDALGDKIESVSLKAGAANGQLVLTVDGQDANPVSVPGLGSAAYTESSAYATSAQGQKADSAYQKPSGGIPNTDLAQGVQNSLGLADSALQGITAGNNITIDTSDPKRPVINSTGGGGITEIEPLTIQLNGTDEVVFDGSEAQSVNITAAGVGAEPTIATKGTAFNKDFGTSAGTVMEGNDSRVTGAVQSVTFAGTELTKTDGAAEITQSEARAALGLGSAAYTASTAYATAAQGALANSAYQKPSAGIPATDLAQGVRDSLALANSALQSVPDATATQKGVATLGAAGGAARYGQKSDVGLSNVANVLQYSANNPPPYPVTSVAGRTGAVKLTKADVELDNVANERQYSANNPPPYPVTSVAGKTGVVTLEKADVGLGNVDNTADLDKPVSTATQNALNAKIGNTGTQSIAGNLTLVADSGGNGNLVVQGDLTVQGTTITEEHETLNVVDNLIVTNSEGASLTDLSGVAIRKNETDTYGVLYDPVSDSVKLGLGTIDAEGDFAFNPGEGKPVTIRDDSANLTDGHLLEWDSTENKVVDGGAKPTALPNPHALTLGSKVYNGSSDVTLLASDIDAEPAFAKNTAFNKNFGTSADTVAQGNDSRIVSAVQSAMFSGVALEKSGTQLSISQESARTALGLGTAAYTNVGDNVVDVGAVAGLPAPATGQVSLTVSEEIASRIRDNEDSIIKVRLLLPESTSEGTVIYLRRNTNMWVDVSPDMDIWSCMLDVSMYEGHEVVAISYVAAFNPSSDAPTLGIQAVEIRDGAKVVDIGQISLNFMETGDVSVNITNEQYDALEHGDRTILKFSTSDGQNIYLNCFCLGNGIIYSAMIAESGIVAAYTANIGGSSQKMVAIRASAVYGGTEGNIATVIDIGTVANFSFAEEGNWTVNISDEMYSKITAPAQETTQIKFADASGNVAYLTRYVDTDGSLIFASIYTDTSQATLMQLFADVRGSAGNYKIEIACTMSLLGPHPQFINIGVVQGFEFGVEGSWSVNISDTIYNQIAEGDDVRIVISDANSASVVMPQVAAIQGKKMFGTNSILDQNGARIEYAAGASGVPGQYRLEIIAVVVEAGGGGGVEIVNLGTPTFKEANGGQYLLANLTLTGAQAAKLKAEPAPVVKFTLSGASGDYQNGTYYITKTFLHGGDGHLYNTCFQTEDNGGWAIALQTIGATAAIITIYPYKIPQEVEANPSDSTSGTLEKLKVGDVTYAIPQGSEIVDLGALTFNEGASGAQANGTITQEQYNTLSASGTSPIIKFTDNTNEVLCQRTGSLESERDGITYYTYAANTNMAIPAQIQSYAVIIFGQGSNYGMQAFRVTIKPDEDGKAATIQVGEVTTGAAGSQASVTNSGTENAAVFDFTIPQGADGASGVTDVTAGTPTEQNGYTVTPVTFNFEQGNSKTVNIPAKNGEGAGLQQNDVINRTASVDTADENSPDFVEYNGDLWVKKIAGYEQETVTTLEATLPDRTGYISAATAPNGKIYVFGGVITYGTSTTRLKDIVEFDPVTQTVKTLSPLKAALPNLTSSTSAATAPNGKIYVFGGRTNATGSGRFLDDIVEFDPVTQSVTTLEVTLPNKIDFTSAATAPNGKIYVFGGSPSGSTNIIEFDPVAKTVTTLEATLPSGRWLTSAATAPNGKIYVFGGNPGNGYLDDIIEFDPVAKTVTTLEATLPSGRYGTSAATAPNGKIYVFGGSIGSDRYSYDIVEFDPVMQTVNTLETRLGARGGTSAAIAPNGKIYVFGGIINGYWDDIVEFAPPVAQYAYSPAVVLSQEEYAQFKNILNGVFSVRISAPNAEISGTLEAGNTTVNGTLTATGDISTVGGATVGANLSVMGDASAQNVTASGAITADSAEVNGTLSAGNTTVGTLSASGAVTASSFNATT